MKIILTIKAVLNYLYNNLIDLVWVKKIKFEDDTEINTKPLNLFDIKTMSERIANKNWCCISDSSPKRLTKSQVSTAYEFIKEKLDNVDGTMSEPTLATGSPQLFYNGYYYFYSGTKICRSRYADLSLAEDWVDIGQGANYVSICLATINNTTIFICHTKNTYSSHLSVINENGNILSSQSFSGFRRVISVTSGRTIVIDNYAYYVFIEDSSFYIYKIDVNGTVTSVFSLDTSYKDNLFFKGINPDFNWSGWFTNYISSAIGYNNRIYWSISATTFWYDLETNTYDYQYNLLNYGWGLGGYWGTTYQEWGSYLLIYNNKLCMLSGYSDGTLIYYSEFNENLDTFELIRTLDVSSKPYRSATDDLFIHGIDVYDNVYYMLIRDKNNITTNCVYTTTNFVDINKTDIYTFDSFWIIYKLIKNNNDMLYVTTNNYYVCTGYVLTVYTDTINGIDIKYYKNGDWKICTPDIAVGNDDNLQAVYEYLGYLNYWWIDTTNEQITLQRNSNLWRMMYVGDDYEDSSLPSGNYLPSKTVAETIEIDTTSITIANIKPNKNYVFTNNAITDITLTACEQSMEETTIQFTTGSSAPTLTDNSGLVWFGGIPTLQANTTYVIVIFNKQAFYQEQGA